MLQIEAPETVGFRAPPMISFISFEERGPPNIKQQTSDGGAFVLVV